MRYSFEHPEIATCDCCPMFIEHEGFSQPGMCLMNKRAVMRAGHLAKMEVPAEPEYNRFIRRCEWLDARGWHIYTSPRPDWCPLEEV